MVQVERLTREVKLVLNGDHFSILSSDGIFKAGEYSQQEILELIRLAQAQGWELVSMIPKNSEETGQHFMYMFFRKAEASDGSSSDTP